MSASSPSTTLYDGYGNGSVAVKLSNTAPTTSDNALVVVISPNQPTVPINFSTPGMTYIIDFAINTSASQSSTNTIPVGAIVVRTDLTITTPYSGGTTISIGQTGSTSLLQSTADNFPTTVGEYTAEQRTSWGSSALPVLATISGSPSVGAGNITVEYVQPLN